MVLMNLLSLGMIVYNQVTPYIIVESRSFLFHPWQICHATNLTNISFWLPNFTSFFHQSNGPRKWKQIICKYNIPFLYFYLQPWKTSCFTGNPSPISHPLVPIKTFLLSFYDPSIQVQNSHSSPFQFNSFTSDSRTCRGTLLVSSLWSWRVQILQLLQLHLRTKTFVTSIRKIEVPLYICSPHFSVHCTVPEVLKCPITAPI